MSTSLKNFGIKFSTNIPVDEFIEKALYDPKFGYYTNKNPFGKSGDFITAPNISNLFSEIILIWLVSSWETFGKPKNFNFVELGPGDGSLTKVISNTCKRFPEFDNAINIYLYEKSNFLKKIQKKKIKNNKIKWIKDFNSIKKGPVIFFGNELIFICNGQFAKAEIRRCECDGNMQFIEKKDNNVIQTASANNLMGNPLNVLQWLVDYLNEREMSLQKGDKISLGSVGKLFPLSKNVYKYYFEGFEESKYVVKINVK